MNKQINHEHELELDCYRRTKRYHEMGGGNSGSPQWLALKRADDIAVAHEQYERGGQEALEAIVSGRDSSVEIEKELSARMLGAAAAVPSLKNMMDEGRRLIKDSRPRRIITAEALWAMYREAY